MSILRARKDVLLLRVNGDVTILRVRKDVILLKVKGDVAILTVHRVVMLLRVKGTSLNLVGLKVPRYWSKRGSRFTKST
jgi:hypothetical protein